VSEVDTAPEQLAHRDDGHDGTPLTAPRPD
jgi:hypothetical protein